VEDEEAADTELKSFPGLAFKTDTTTGSQRMVVAQALAVVCGTEKASEIRSRLERTHRLRSLGMSTPPSPPQSH
jgi:hypothetical protein